MTFLAFSSRQDSDANKILIFSEVFFQQKVVDLDLSTGIEVGTVEKEICL